jgi:hypothetical protein
MRRSIWFVLLVGLGGCAGSGPDSTSGSTTGSATTTAGSTTGGTTGSTCVDSWSGFAQGFFSSYCASCHSAYDQARVQSGAPRYADAISSGFMPRGNQQPSAEERARIVAYLRCVGGSARTTGTTGGPPPTP